MARKKTTEGVNKSQSIRDLLKANPKIKAAEAIAELKSKGVDTTINLFYLVKGKMLGGRKRRGRKASAPTAEARPTSQSNALATIKRVKLVASEVGGLKSLAAIVDALSM